MSRAPQQIQTVITWTVLAISPLSIVTIIDSIYWQYPALIMPNEFKMPAGITRWMYCAASSTTFGSWPHERRMGLQKMTGSIINREMTPVITYCRCR